MRDNKESSGEHDGRAGSPGSSSGSTPVYDSLLSRLINDCKSRVDDSVAIAVATATANYSKEMDSRLADALAAAEMRHKLQQFNLLNRLDEAERRAECQDERIVDLQDQVSALQATLSDSSASATTETATINRIVSAAEVRCTVALLATENRIDEALTSAKVDSAHQLQASHNSFGVALQAAEERYLDSISKIDQGAMHSPEADKNSIYFKRLDDLEAKVQGFTNSQAKPEPRVSPVLFQRLLALNARVNALEARVAAAARRPAHQAKPPSGTPTSAALDSNPGTEEVENSKLPQRLQGLETSYLDVLKAQQKLAKRMHALEGTLGGNNMSLARAQQTLGERLRLLEEGVAASNAEHAHRADGQRAELQALQRAFETQTTPAAGEGSPLSIRPTNGDRVLLRLEELADLADKHESFLTRYGDRIIAVTHVYGGGKLGDLSLPKLEHVQECFRDVKRLSSLKAGDIAQHYMNRIERKRAEVDRSGDAETPAESVSGGEGEQRLETQGSSKGKIECGTVQ